MTENSINRSNKSTRCNTIGVRSAPPELEKEFVSELRSSVHQASELQP